MKLELRGKSLAIVIASLVFVAMLVTSALLAYFSPEYSWSASIRDHDGDGYADAEDAFPYDAAEWADADSDGSGDNGDEFPSDSTQWNDMDGDGYGDNLSGIRPDHFRDDPTEWNDTDGDGVGDNGDIFPLDPSQWSDLDGDGYGDNLTGTLPDLFRDEPTEWNDTDGDGVGDNGDAFPGEPSQCSDLDGDGYGDNLTGVLPDLFRDDPNEWNDTDGDGVGDNSDAYPDDPDLWEQITPVATYSKTFISSGVRITIISISMSDVSWSDVTILLADGTNFAEWSPDATNLDGGSAVSSNLTTDGLGSLTVCCVVFDIAGNGYVSGSDFFQIFTYGGATAFSAATSYSTVLIYEPTGEKIGTGIIFTG